MTLAISQAVIHHQALSAFTESLQAEHAKELVEWGNQVWKWESDRSLPCPYDLPDQSTSIIYGGYNVLNSIIEVTFAQVKHQLSQEEHEKVVKGKECTDLDDITPSAFIIAALELEETQ
jgi:hypothetical protein